MFGGCPSFRWRMWRSWALGGPMATDGSPQKDPWGHRRVHTLPGLLGQTVLLFLDQRGLTPPKHRISTHHFCSQRPRKTDEKVARETPVWHTHHRAGTNTQLSTLLSPCYTAGALSSPLSPKSPSALPLSH